jgi:hypothetical protein
VLVGTYAELRVARYNGSERAELGAFRARVALCGSRGTIYFPNATFQRYFLTAWSEAILPSRMWMMRCACWAISFS